jgi:pimeloyl-ACP methyl ester carboxylesterase
VSERRGEVAGLPVFWHEVEARGAAPVLYLHGVPTNADDFLPFLERTGGIAPDLPGFGRSGKPADFDYSISGYRAFLAAFLEERGVDHYSLVVHDWGAVGLALAQAAPNRVERLVLMNCATFLPGYRWHWMARTWRTPFLGELFMGLSSRWAMRQTLRPATTLEGGLPAELIDRMWEHFDHGTQRAILKLYRSAPPEVLAHAGERLGELTCPALVAWGTEDPFVDTSFAQAYADALGGNVRLKLLEDAGHWPWIDRPETVELVARFLLDDRR